MNQTEIKWEPSMFIGERTIDEQHKKLFDQIDKITQILSSSDINMGLLRETNHFLYLYFKKHFSYEEEYMIKNKFPSFEGHKKVHQTFIQFYEDFQKEIKEKSTSKNFSSLDVKEMLEKVREYLGYWLVNHIKGMDQIYAKYIRNHSK